MLKPDQWQEAQQAEARYWKDLGRNSWRVLYELQEHCGALCKVLPKYLKDRCDQGIEIGVGPLGIGFFSIYASHFIGKIIGVEPLPRQEICLEDKALETYVRTLQGRTEYVRCPGEQLPYADGTFGIACCINVLDHTHGPDEILKEIARVTCPGGLCLLAVHTRSVPGLTVRKLARMAKPGLGSAQSVVAAHKLNLKIKQATDNCLIFLCQII